jgi:glycosyltransferase involved in cell wall biosynthesis
MSAGYSIVVPTRDGGERLERVLDALERQRGAPDFEVVVADDGSTDGTPERLAGRPSGRRVTISRGAASGPAAARNRGVRAAAAPRIAFLGDDTEPEPDWLAALDAAWRARGSGAELAVLGYTTWHPRLVPTRFLRWLNEEGLQFGFSLIRDAERVPFNFFYTSNVTLGRDLLLAEPFDETFPYAAWEDIEAAYRFERRGMRLVYEPRARVLHDHPTDFLRFAARQERAGYCAVVFWRRHPELGGFLGLSEAGPPPRTPPIRRRFRDALVRSLQSFPVVSRSLWSAALRDHYVEGLHRGWRELVSRPGGAS